MYKKATVAPSKTPAPKADRIIGSKKNAAGSAKSSSSASKISLNHTTIAALRKKLKDFREKYPDNKKVSENDLKAVYRRGSGAYSKSHRPTISGGKPNSRAAWSYARVNAFLRKAAGLEVKKAYIQDDDLLKKGGQINPDEFALVVYHEEQGNWMVEKNKVYVWLYEDLDAAKKLQNDEYDWVIFPPSTSISMAFRRGYVPPLKQIWTKKYQKERRGSDKLVGIVEGWYDEKNNKLYVLMMTTRKDYRRRGVNSYLITYLRQKFGLEKDQVIFDNPTDEGKMFEASGKYHLGGDMKKHLAPNGKPSYLTHEQWHMVRTPEFKAWFGDWENDPENASKVVDENGEPMVVYHGSATKFRQFSKIFQGLKVDRDIVGFYFSDLPDVAYTYTYNDDYEKYMGENYVRAFFLNVRKLKTVDAADKIFGDPSYWDNKYDKLVKSAFNKKTDGVLIKNIIDLLQGTVKGLSDYYFWGNTYVVFEPNNIKLADGSNTTFDGGNPDIRYERGGGVGGKNKTDGGDCYLSAGKMILESRFKLPSSIEKFDGEPYLVHAEVRGQGALNGIRYGHAWIEDDSMVYDFSNNREIIVPKQLYYYFGDVKKDNPKKYRRYTFEEARDKMLETGNYGCWDIETKYKSGGAIYKSDSMQKIQLPDTESSYENLQPILARQGYLLSMDIKPSHSVSEIAEKHGVSVADINEQLQMGIKHETEHYYSKEKAKTTALHHLWEDPKYYTHLKKMEMDVEGQKLENYYATGGSLPSEGGNCEIVTEDGERAIDNAAIKSLTSCLENLPQTKSLHFDFEKEEYKPYRKRLHKDIIYSFKKDLVCVEREQPIAILMGGSPASGKSTFLKKYAPYLLNQEIFKIDADEVRSKLPEYRGYNASQTHLETKDIVSTMLSDRNIGIPCRFDLIYDGTMNNTKSYLPLINLLKEDGYKVFIVYIDKVPKDVIIERALLRYKNSGRFVPLEVIDDFFNKGTEALEQLKNEVDGFMIVDGSNSEYKVIERGGEQLPKDREYSKIGSPINITSEEVVRELKKGGEINPDNTSIKNAITHKAGSAGGLLVGNRHSEGGIKAINKSTGQPLEMEGGEVVITRNAVSDSQKREFEGEMLTNREILSRINESGGGVSFAAGGDVPHKCACSGKEYKFGGKVMRDNEIVKSICDLFPDLFAFRKPIQKSKTEYAKYGLGGSITYSNTGLPTLRGFANAVNSINPLNVKKDYIKYLASEYSVDFEELPNLLKSALLLGNQKLIDKYIKR